MLDVSLESVAVVVVRLVHVPRVGIMDRHDPPRAGHRGDPPRPVTVAGFNILASHERQQTDRFGLHVIELDTSDRGQDRVRVAHHLGHDPVDVGPVIPRARRLARIVVVSWATSVRATAGDEAADPADLGDELHDGVLTGDSVVEYSRVHPGGSCPSERSWRRSPRGRLEDPLRAIAGAQLVAPQREHRPMEALDRDPTPQITPPGESLRIRAPR